MAEKSSLKRVEGESGGKLSPAQAFLLRTNSTTTPARMIRAWTKSLFRMLFCPPSRVYRVKTTPHSHALPE